MKIFEISATDDESSYKKFRLKKISILTILMLILNILNTKINCLK